MTFKFADRLIGPNNPPLVIAEVGINHDGSLEKALQMVDSAVAAGCEVIKFQCHITDKEMIPTDMTPGDISAEKLWDIIKRCEFTLDEEIAVQRYCAEKGIIYLSTPFSREAADRLEDMGVAGFKIGSGECNNFPLIEHIAAKGLPMIVSTGMNDIQSIRKTVEIVQKHGTDIALLHCTSMYPTPYTHVRLGAIADLQNNFSEIPIGLSDHSMNIWTCLGAVNAGACILEKHFTETREWPGPDISISITPKELADLIEGSRAVWEARGGSKTVLDDEKPVIEFAYATVVSINQIRKGEVFSKDNIWVKRPGTGPILAERFEDVLGKRALVDIGPNVHIQPEDIEGLA